MMQIRKTNGANGIGQVNYLPDGWSPTPTRRLNSTADVGEPDTSAPYIGPNWRPANTVTRCSCITVAVSPGFGGEEGDEHRGARGSSRSAFDALNLTNSSCEHPSSTSFGRTTSAYNDFAGSADPGSRLIEFRLRVSF